MAPGNSFSNYQRAGLIALVILLWFVRRPEPFISPMLYAEDGPVFFVQADQCRWQALTFTYSGYLHTFQRFWAAVVSYAPLQWVPTLYFWTSLIAPVLVATALTSPRCPLRGSPLLITALAFVPHTGEVFGNLTNTQWFLGLLLLLVVISREPKRVADYAADFSTALIVGLTGLFSVLFLPLFALRAWQRRTRASWLLLACIAATSAIQLRTFIPAATSVEGPPLSLAQGIAVLGHRVVTAAFLGRHADGLPSWVWLAAGALFFAGAIAAVLRWPKDSPRLPLLAALVAITLAGALRLRDTQVEAMAMRYADRYYFIPKVLLAWVLIDWLLARFPTAWTRSAIAAVLVLGAAITPQEIYAEFRWAPYARQIERYEKVRVITNPYEFSFEYQRQPR
ncbi:hypothetical protein [Nibricoccus sp. IMCC34717]|uniref:hypothetical protein n=1 Tax=Nibricoccus sp. IMCC34717 TaxID=3034021 RepID=UPI00384BE450